jgi:hypothetical protein
MKTNRINKAKKRCFTYGLNLLSKRYDAPREMGMKTIGIAREPIVKNIRPKAE